MLMRTVFALIMALALSAGSPPVFAKPFKGQKLSCEAFLQSHGHPDRRRAGRILGWIDNTLTVLNHFSLPSERLGLPMAELPGYISDYCRVFPKHRIADGLLAANTAEQHADAEIVSISTL
jgi:hypothetical protein